jgi:opacity protein-like surface antigen
MNPNPKTGELRKYVMRLGYIELPVTVGWRAENWLSVLAGLSYNRLVNSREFDNYGDLPPQETLPFNESTWDLMAGARFNILPKLQVDIRYAFSLTPIRNLPGQSLVYIRDDQYSSAITSTLFYRIDW